MSFVLLLSCQRIQALKVRGLLFFMVKLKCVSFSLSIMCESEVKVKSLSRVQLFATPWTVTYQAPQSMGFSRQEY